MNPTLFPAVLSALIINGLPSTILMRSLTIVPVTEPVVNGFSINISHVFASEIYADVLINGPSPTFGTRTDLSMSTKLTVVNITCDPSCITNPVSISPTVPSILSSFKTHCVAGPETLKYSEILIAGFTSKCAKPLNIATSGPVEVLSTFTGNVAPATPDTIVFVMTTASGVVALFTIEIYPHALVN